MIEKQKDTLFIDMKYIILYRKLGYAEIAPDIFSFKYSDTSIIIESEQQRYRYLNQYYPLVKYRDFVILECIDRLLKLGYGSDEINRPSVGPDLRVNDGNGHEFVIFAAQWGRDYQRLCTEHIHRRHNIECLYTSQLSGGLVDFISCICTDAGRFDHGIFEEGQTPFVIDLHNIEYDIDYPEEFIVHQNELIHYAGDSPHVIVPQGITKIGAGAFWNDLKLKTIDLPDTVTCICGDAFVYCENLASANIPKKVKQIGDDPFAGCLHLSLNNESPNFIENDRVLFDRSAKILIHYSADKPDDFYEIPLTVEWIGKHSFYKCSNLKCVRITKNVKYMGNNAFSDCHNIQLINESSYFNYLNGVLYDQNITTCMHYSMGSGIKTVVIEPTVRTIGRNCFWNCDMVEHIVIPASVRQIGYNPFANCRNAVIENHSPFYTESEGVLFDSTMSELVCCPPTAAKTTMNVPESVINIGRNAFTGCEKIKTIRLPARLRYISRSAFSGCTSLETIEIPASVNELGDWCFAGCSSLKTVWIPKRLCIKPNTFDDCPAGIVRV